MRKIDTAVITAAGYGSRFFPVVKSIPKEMLPIGNKPILQYVVEECIEAGMKRIIIVVREGVGDIIKDYFTNPCTDAENLMIEQGKEERYESIKKVLDFKGIEIIAQESNLPYGNGSPILSAKKYLNKDEPFAALFADDLVYTQSNSAISQLVDFYKENSECEALMAVQEVSLKEVCKYASIKPRKDYTGNQSGVIDYLVEKPKLGTEPSNLVSYGRFILPYRIFDYLLAGATGKDGELWLQDANDKIAQDGKYFYLTVEGQWMTTGDPLRFIQTEIMYALHNDGYKDEVRDFIKNSINESNK